MKALVLESVGKLVYKDVPKPCPRDGEVLISVKACGICSSDFDRCLRTGTYHFPTIPGHEFSGEIVSAGNQDDVGLIGEKAVVFPLLPCHICDQCRINAYARCRNYSYFGSRCDGAFAEYISVPIWNVQICPKTIDYRVAALCEPAAVAYHAVSAAQIGGRNKTVCVVGTGAIGIMTGIWSRESGVDVTFVCRNKAKRDFLSELGFSSFLECGSACNSEFDCVYECVGSDQSLREAIALAGTAKQIVLVGNPDDDKSIARGVYWKILRNELTIKGVWNSCYSKGESEWSTVVSELAKHQNLFALLVTSEFPLSLGLSAFDSIRSGRKLEVKGMFVNE